MIEVHGLTKFFGDHRAVDHVDFAIDKGRVVGFLGLNGAGKTTILRMLAGDLEPSGGSIRVDGRDLLDDPAGYRRRVGFLPEKVPTYDDMTVREYLAYVGALRGLAGADLHDRIDKVAARVGVSDHLDVHLTALSHGYEKRVGIASVVVHEPDLVILDEAISGLDPVQIVEMRSLIRDLAGERTVLVSSHILTEISETCDDILVIQDGRIAARGTEQELRGRLGAPTELALELRAGPEAAERAVRAVPGVTSIEVYEREGDVVVVKVRSDRDVREDLVRACVLANLGVLGLERSERRLEAAFLGLVRGGGAAAQAAPAGEAA